MAKAVLFSARALLPALLLVGCATHQPSAAPRSWAPLIERISSWAASCPPRFIRGLNIHFCQDPAGGDHDYGAVAYIGEPQPENYIGIAWGIRYYGGMRYDANAMRILLRTDAGRDHLGAPGARPSFLDCYEESGQEIGLVILLRGENGAVGTRTVVFPWFIEQGRVPPCRAQPKAH